MKQMVQVRLGNEVKMAEVGVQKDGREFYFSPFTGQRTMLPRRHEWEYGVGWPDGLERARSSSKRSSKSRRLQSRRGRSGNAKPERPAAPTYEFIVHRKPRYGRSHFEIARALKFQRGLSERKKTVDSKVGE